MMLRGIMFLGNRIRRFESDEDGVAAIEFAFIAPIMLMIFFGCVEFSDGFSASRKVTLVTHTVADLVAQASQPITNMTDLLAAGQAVMLPYSGNNLQMQVSSITIDAANNASIAWTRVSNWAAPVAVPALDPALNKANSSLIWMQTQYTYTPPIGAGILQFFGLPNGTITLSDQTFLRPRVMDPVPAPTG